MRRIAAVTFDLWNTLIQEHLGSPEKVSDFRIDGVWRVLNDRGMMHSREEVASAYAKTFDFLQLTWSKRRDMPVRDHVLFMLTSIDSKLTGKLTKADIAEIEKKYSEGILEHPPMLIPGAKEMLKAVRSRGYRMGLISNTGRTPGTVLRVVMDKLGILECFDTATFSNEILIRKPAEEAFTITLDKLRVVPKAAVHVGDSVENDIVGAKKSGMHALQLVPYGERPSDAADGHVKSLEYVLDGIERL